MAEEARLRTLREQVTLARGRRAEVQRSLADARSSVRRLDEDVDLLNHVGELLRTLVDGEITEGVKVIEELQTEGVKAVFHDLELKVRADVEVSRGKVNVSLVTSQRKENGDLIEGASLEGFGGSVSTVQSVLLRLALLFRRGLRPILFLDETLPALDDRYVHNMAGFLKILCSRLGVDIFLVTHNHSLVDIADRAYQVKKTNRGCSVVQRIR